MTNNQEAVTPAASQTAANSAAKGGSRAVAMLALLLALLAMAVSCAALWWLNQQLAETPPQSIAATQGITKIERQLAKVQQELSLVDGAATTQRQIVAAVQDSQQALMQREDESRQSLAIVTERLEDLANADRTDWQLAEIEYLLRLANQRLLTSYDVAGALALLASADRISTELGQADLFPLRRQLAVDIAALRGTAQLDVEGIYLQMSALVTTVDRLVFVGPPVFATAPQIDNIGLDGESTGQQIESGWRQAWAALGSLVRVTPRRLEVQPQLTLDQRLLVRAQLKLLLEQAKNALLLRQQTIYRTSLEQARTMLVAYFDAADAATVAALESCAQLNTFNVDPTLPDISQSQTIMLDLLRSRDHRAGALQ